FHHPAHAEDLGADAAGEDTVALALTSRLHPHLAGDADLVGHLGGGDGDLVALGGLVEDAVLAVAEAVSQELLEWAGHRSELRGHLNRAADLGVRLLELGLLVGWELQAIAEQSRVVVLVEEELLPHGVGVAVVDVLDAYVSHGRAS